MIFFIRLFSYFRRTNALSLVIAFPTKTLSWHFSVALSATLFALMNVIRGIASKKYAKLKNIVYGCSVFFLIKISEECIN